MVGQHRPAPHLGLLKVQVLADGGEQAAEALQTLLVVVLEQLDHAVVHDGFGQHLQLEELADEPDVADGASARLVLGLLQLGLQVIPLAGLQQDRTQLERAGLTLTIQRGLILYIKGLVLHTNRLGTFRINR